MCCDFTAGECGHMPHDPTRGLERFPDCRGQYIASSSGAANMYPATKGPLAGVAVELNTEFCTWEIRTVQGKQMLVAKRKT